MSAKQPMFDIIPKVKRKPPRVMAKLDDAGGENEPMAFYICKKCGWESGWISEPRCTTSVLAGIPCEKCNTQPTTPKSEVTP